MSRPDLLETATVRLEILAGRMRACPSHKAEETHKLSLFEVEGWIAEQRESLVAPLVAPAPPSLEDRLVVLIAAYEMDEPHWDDGSEPEVRWDASLLREWLDDSHSGDCTGEPHSCRRCMVEHVWHKARWIAAALYRAPSDGHISELEQTARHFSDEAEKEWLIEEARQAWVDAQEMDHSRFVATWAGHISRSYRRPAVPTVEARETAPPAEPRMASSEAEGYVMALVTRWRDGDMQGFGEMVAEATRWLGLPPVVELREVDPANPDPSKWCSACGHLWSKHGGSQGCEHRVDSAWTPTNDRLCCCSAKLSDYAEPAEPLECTGIAACWCPIHGDCICRDNAAEDGEWSENPACPLHGLTSNHADEAEPTAPSPGGDTAPRSKAAASLRHNAEYVDHTFPLVAMQMRDAASRLESLTATVEAQAARIARLEAGLSEIIASHHSQHRAFNIASRALAASTDETGTAPGGTV